MLKLHKINFHLGDVQVVAILAGLISLAATIWSLQQGYILAYGDAESHLDIAKRVINGLTPGFGQLGGIWLPLHHILMLPFVWNDWLWRTGLAGSFVSMGSYVISALCLF